MGTGTDVTPKSLTFGGHIIITCPAGSMHRMGVGDFYPDTLTFFLTSVSFFKINCLKR